MKLSVGPNFYYWPKEKTLEFYRRLIDLPVDIIYLGETVCAKRKQMHTEDWLALAEELAAAGKEVVLSTLALSGAESDMHTLKRICHNEQFVVEANDFGAVGVLEGRPFVAGPGVNLYNHKSIAWLAQLGLKRWVLPVELGCETLKTLQAHRPDNLETEVFAFGRLPLAYSARCYTARAHQLQKDQCQHRCLEYPEGMVLSTQEEQVFLAINGTQMLSAQTYDVIAELTTLEALGVDILRLSPQPEYMDKVIDTFHLCLSHRLTPADAATRLKDWVPSGVCNGYWYGDAGIKSI